MTTEQSGGSIEIFSAKDFFFLESMRDVALKKRSKCSLHYLKVANDKYPTFMTSYYIVSFPFFWMSELVIWLYSGKISHLQIVTDTHSVITSTLLGYIKYTKANVHMNDRLRINLNVTTMRIKTSVNMSPCVRGKQDKKRSTISSCSSY